MQKEKAILCDYYGKAKLNAPRVTKFAPYQDENLHVYRNQIKILTLYRSHLTVF